MPTWQNKFAVTALAIMALFLSFSQPAFAGTNRHKGPPTKKLLNLHKIKVMSMHVAADVKRQELFSKPDLPPKMSMGLFEIKVLDSTVTSRQFTDAVLNHILNNEGILIVNQDSQLGDSLDFQLQRYEDRGTLRTRAGLLGAHYYIVGSISEHTMTTERGKIKKGYKIDYEVCDVHSNNTLIQNHLIFSDGGKYLKEKKPHGRRAKSKS